MGKRKPFLTPQGSRLGWIASRGGHYPSQFDILDRQLGPGALPTASKALMQLDYNAAIKGDRKALKRSLRYLRDLDLTIFRWYNRDPNCVTLIENIDFERIDEVLELLGLVLLTPLSQVIIQNWSKKQPYNPATDSDSIRYEVPEWLIEACRARAGTDGRIIGWLTNHPAPGANYSWKANAFMGRARDWGWTS